MSKKKFPESSLLFDQASKLIPMASQTYSKSYINFDKHNSPLFLDRGKGAYVWDIDNNKYIDFIMALLPNILGYNDKDINNSIILQLKKGISFSLATKLEYHLAEILVEIIPSAEMVRFAKNGSDATGAAIRLARAATGKDKIIVCGYHGWHDWYIGSTEKDLGVPENVKKLTVSVEFNDIGKIQKLFENNPNDYAALIIEPEGAELPKNKFLNKIRSITKKYKTVLIFDEIVSGFRSDLGGAQKKYKVIPDLTTLGKAMANGMPLSALVGKKSIMKLNEEIFFSGTFSGETLSLAASIATITKLRNNGIIEKLITLGSRIRDNVEEIISSNRLEGIICLKGPDWRPFFHYKNSEYDKNILTHIIRKEFISHGILFGSAFNLSFPHTEKKVFDNTLRITNLIFKSIKEKLNSSEKKLLFTKKKSTSSFSVRKK